MPSNHLILCCPFLLPPSIFPSIRVFSNELAFSIKWPKYWSFSFSISPSNEYSGLISFRMDWFDLFIVQGTHKSLLQHSSKAPGFWHSAFFTVQLSHPYLTTGKTNSFDYTTLVGKVMCLFLNTPSRFVIAFLPRSKCLLISEGAVLSVNKGLLLSAQSDASRGKKQSQLLQVRLDTQLSRVSLPLCTHDPGPQTIMDDFSVNHFSVSPRWRLQ